MENKTLMTAIIIWALLTSIVVGVQVVKIAKANPFIGLENVEPIPGTTPPNITIFSPQNNTVYSSNNTTLSFNVSKPELPTAWQSGLGHITYTLDNETVEVYSLYTSNDDAPFSQGFTYTHNLTLPEGNHYLTVDANGVVYPNNTSIFESDSSSNVFFITGNNTRSLTVMVNSPQNRTYTSNIIPVSISASDPFGGIGPESVAYSVDGGPQVIITTVHVGMHSLTNSTVLSLPNGEHSIVGIGITWFNGTDGVFYSSPVHFTIDPTPTPSPSSSIEPSPTASVTPSPSIPVFPSWIILPLLITVVIGVSLLVYFKKRKH